LLRDGLLTEVVKRATGLFGLQRGIVARRVEGKCCLYYLAFMSIVQATAQATLDLGDKEASFPKTS